MALKCAVVSRWAWKLGGVDDRGGEVLGTALIPWLKNGDDDINVAKEVVQVLWPRVSEGRSPAHSAWATSYETKVELAT